MDKQHIIISVGRQLGSGGRVIAQQLAKEFDCQFYDRELLNLAIKANFTSALKFFNNSQ